MRHCTHRGTSLECTGRLHVKLCTLFVDFVVGFFVTVNDVDFILYRVGQKK